jgi:hypothetical protein
MYEVGGEQREFVLRAVRERERDFTIPYPSFVGICEMKILTSDPFIVLPRRSSSLLIPATPPSLPRHDAYSA